MSNELQLRDEILDMLENILAYAKGGQVVSIAIAAQMTKERNYETLYIDHEHGNVAAMNLSIDSLKWRLLGAINGFGEDSDDLDDGPYDDDGDDELQ